MLIEAEIWTVARTDQGNAVLIRPVNAEVAVPIFIGQLEAQSILIGLGNVPMPRPNTHDLLLSIMGMLNAKIEKVEIVALKDGIFYAQLTMKQDEKTLMIDSRPSDAIALAVRSKCSIYIADAVVDEAGIPLTSITEESKETRLTDNQLEKMQLEQDLQKAVEEENYEEAARLRDVLARLEGIE
ncbi:MAG: bifunctional nuclease family protein [Spirochaetales bacterium]|nr:bifunctional nuclease family protein [Spirochaetales bacterium]